MTSHVIPVRPGNPYPLGRHVNHDERSRAFPYVPPREVALRTLAHRSYGLPLDQGQLGSCTGNAVAGACNTVPVHATGDPVLTESDAIAIYHIATNLDPFEGSYPPDDTGSDGLSACRAAVRLGHINSYRHCFSIGDALQALQYHPVITGVNWYQDMFYPTRDGFVHPTGGLAGGHEFVVRGYVIAKRPYVLCMNSWGTGWGISGKFKLFVDEWEKLLGEQGDAIVVLK